MYWSSEIRYQILLKINNAIITQTTSGDLFHALALELRKHFYCDRISINLYDAKSQSISYFAAADGIAPAGISSLESRSLVKGAISKMVIRSGQPVIIKDLRRYADFESVKSMVEYGLNTTMAFPLVIRKKILGTIHFSYQHQPDYMEELQEVLTEVSRQAAIVVDNMLSYTHLKESHSNLIQQKRYLIANIDDGYQQDSFFYAAPIMQEIMSLVEKVANSDASILITGETGTGKDYVARTVHNMSPRREHLFVKTNCPALAPTLFESELFGHARGAFTGADAKRVGRFELANHGTVFLDEVGELPAELQAKLLHVLQDQRFERVGDSRPIDVNFRVIAATNKDLRGLALNGQFREDLYYRLNTVNIHVPPLRERVEDIPLLIEKLSIYQARKTNGLVPIYSDGALESLCAYHWPGNVRELKNLVKRMVILRPGERITSSDIIKITDINPAEVTGPDVTTLADAERQHIIQALRKCRGMVGGKRGIAKLLGVPRTTLQYRMKKLGINPNDFIH
ncbi:MAG: sigma 54-interacting transcriptional regulator [Deltaproteobacteria bacterium]|jgi:transcriptional regulator with GAF, ATPase, and Fis domain|nr:sigma 54-interacting transcriptional regulator [Deltaproteobacteria bacterium]MBT4644614.1 sigma 54-interacting transcriptional regulator [Deltaproteobacteria bacterium]MBT6499826.1 sigma 54-interacting transcriptional regulator [Deltaproteobacteria bacterium]MBT7712767.1 sigma 54-interacting transcriptional regulator [Deltaproteobacteria bacterium]MBT7890217.1 sigma 54-interacting transcriptional regulator [Deltaproteobacteria bacterium]